MKHEFHCDAASYEGMLGMLNNLFSVDGVGQVLDMEFIRNGLWLSDSAVIENLQKRKGAWEINLLFAHHQKPLQFLSRRITSHSCPRKAAIAASLMRRLAAKDQRGTLSVNISDLRMLPN